jgi:hypothetical protein
MCETWISRDWLYLQVLCVWADTLHDCIRPAKELFYVFLLSLLMPFAGCLECCTSIMKTVILFLLK